MKQNIQTKSIWYWVMQSSDILLRESSLTRLIFRPLVIANPKNPESNVKWTFIYQKKGKNDIWEDSKELSLSSLKKSEGFSLELHSEEVLILLENFENLQQLYAQFGIRRGETNFHITDKNIGDILEKLSAIDERDLVLDAFSKLDISQLENIESLVSINRFSRARDDMRDNMDNGNEVSFWQPLFKREAWILSQIFSSPFVFVEDEFFVWWKRWNNKWGVYTDYLYQNSITRNIAFIEVKSPTTKLIWNRYRWKQDNDNNTVYSISDELSGPINQLLNQKKTFLQKQDSLEETNKYTYNTRCILITWNTHTLTEWQLKSFELYRGSLKDIEIITFNELLKRIENLLELFSWKNMDNNDSWEDIPF